MNHFLTPAACTVLLLATSSPILAAEPARPAGATSAPILVDCDSRSRPSQREVGALLDQHNLGQVYASRARLMAEVARACQRQAMLQVYLVAQPVAHVDDPQPLPLARQRPLPR